jgi:hypothetical protein
MIPRSLPYATIAALCAPAMASAQDTPAAHDPVQITWRADAEVYYQLNLNRPDTKITNARGFDTRAETFSLQLASIGARLAWRSRVWTQLTLQTGLAPSTYTLAEPTLAGSAFAGPSDATLWRFVQEGYGGVALSDALSVEAGVFLSPVGIDPIPARDKWHWTSSNLGYGVPFYHTGARMSWQAAPAHALALWVVNGFNSVVDDTPGPSAMLTYAWTPADTFTLSALYYGGVERSPGDAAGAAWLHMGDVWARWQAHERLGLALHANAGVEPNALGTTWWAAGAAYARVGLTDALSLGARGDVFRERKAARGGQTAGALFWSPDWVASATTTLDWRPVEHMSLRLEHRLDRAAQPLYYQGDDPIEAPTARGQQTITLGLNTWL